MLAAHDGSMQRQSEPVPGPAPLPAPLPSATALGLDLDLVTENSRNFLSDLTVFTTAHFITVTVFDKDRHAEDTELY